MRCRPRTVLLLGWVLFVLCGAVAVIWYVLAGSTAAEQDHRAQVWGTIVAAVTLGPSAIMWGWSRRRATSPGASTAAQVEAAADLLATRMSATWSRQVVDRGIQTPAPVRVRWAWAADDVALSRQELNSSPALSTDPRPVPAVGDQPGQEQVLGSGLVTRLHEEVYARLKHGRLVLIGGAGAGKTGAMILLLLEALRHRDRVPGPDRAGVPVPVWLTLGSWNPAVQGLREWVTVTMTRDHPYLQAAEFGPDVVGQLFDTGRIALFLDGLDEMPPALRGRAMQLLRAQAGGLRVVLTSRPGEYRGTFEAGQQLPYTAVVELRPVGPQAAAAYLLEGQAGSARSRWQQVTGHLQADRDGVLAQTLTTPLTLSLARSACAGADPAWLVSPDLDSEQALRGRLLDQVLVTAYPDPAERAHATYWLGWIAYHMDTSRDLAWWHIPTWIPSWRLHLASGLVFGLVFGLGVGLGGGLVAGLVAGLGGGLVVGLVFGLVFGLVGEQTPRAFAPRLPTIQETRSRLGGGLVVGLVGGLGVGLVVGLMFGLMVGLVFGLVVGLMDVWSVPLTTFPDTTPRSAHRQDVRAQLVGGLGGGLGGGLIFGLGGGLGGGLVFGLMFGLVGGLGGGLVVGLVAGLGASSRVLVVEVVLAVGGRRVRFMPLLEDALHRQVLRQAGAVYQFRHAELQDRLAARYRHEHHIDGAPLPY